MVKAGLSTYVGFLGAAAAALVPMVSTLADAAAPLGVPDKTWVYVSALLTTVTILGRMAQAAVKAAKGADG